MHPLPIPYYHVTKGLCTADPSNRTSRPTTKEKKKIQDMLKGKKHSWKGQSKHQDQTQI